MPRKKASRQWSPCSDPAVGLRRPAEYQGAEFTLTRGPRAGTFTVVGCGIGAKATTVYGGETTGVHALEYEGGKVRLEPKKWVASTYSRLARRGAASPPDPRQGNLPFPSQGARDVATTTPPRAATPAPAKPSSPVDQPPLRSYYREINVATEGEPVIQWASVFGSWAVTHALREDGTQSPLWVVLFQPTRRVMGKPFTTQKEAREYLLEALRLAPLGAARAVGLRGHAALRGLPCCRRDGAERRLGTGPTGAAREARGRRGA